MAVILALNGVRKSHEHKKTRITQSIIMMKKSSNERAGGPPGVNISDGFGGVTASGSKALALVENNSSSHGGGWRQFVGPRRLLGKVGNSLGVWRARCPKPDGDCRSPNVCRRYLVGARISWGK